MASSPEQEIPQEVVQKAKNAYLAYHNEREVPERSFTAGIRAALAAVLPDLQRPLLEEIERLRVIEEAARASACSYFPKTGPQSTMEERNRAAAEAEHRWRRLCDALGPDFKPDDDSAFLAMVEQLERLEAERDARPDLTAEEIEELLVLRGPDAFFSEDHAVWKSARAKLERSLDAHKP